LTEDQWISFQLTAETYAHSVARVREIIPYAEPTPVPGAPSSVAGILNIRGNVVPIISGRRLFGLNEPEQYTEQGRVIILELGSELTGITCRRGGRDCHHC
jgi:purine-binding chemotaxis protein CheW